eukprot:UN26390
MDKENRYKEGISESLKSKVIANNACDYPGPMLVEHVALVNAKGQYTGWEKVESLSKQVDYYYYNKSTNESVLRPPEEVYSFQEGEVKHKQVNYVNPARPTDFDTT